MKKIVLLLSIILVFSLILVSAHGEETFAQAEKIIQQKISCDELTEDQLELIGDYYMEQMHPGEAHEIMDEMMGGEGSESLRQMHINMGLAFYCGEHEVMSSGMMDMMMGRNMMTGMMPYSYSKYNFNWFFGFLIAITVVLLAILIYNQTQKK